MLTGVFIPDTEISIEFNLDYRENQIQNNSNSTIERVLLKCKNTQDLFIKREILITKNGTFLRFFVIF